MFVGGRRGQVRGHGRVPEREPARHGQPGHGRRAVRGVGLGRSSWARTARRWSRSPSKRTSRRCHRHDRDGQAGLALLRRRPPDPADAAPETEATTELIDDGGTMTRTRPSPRSTSTRSSTPSTSRPSRTSSRSSPGFPDSYEGVTQQANKGSRYLNPFLSTSRRVFGELTRDTRAFESLIVDGASLSGAPGRAARRPQPARLERVRRPRRDRRRAPGAGRHDQPAPAASCARRTRPS